MVGIEKLRENDTEASKIVALAYIDTTRAVFASKHVFLLLNSQKLRWKKFLANIFLSSEQLAV